MTMNHAPTSSLTASRIRSLPVTVAREIGLVLAGTAAIALIGQISLPLPFTPVPVTLGTLAALGVGGILGGRRGLASVSLLAALAAGGAPVLAGWTSGVTASFGYVLGYALIAVVAGHATSRTTEGPRYGLPARAAFMVLASVAVYVPGLIWLKLATGATWSAVVGMGMLPFLVGDALKSALAALLPTRRI